MHNWLDLLRVHSWNISFDEDDSDVNMTVSDDGEGNSVSGEDKSNGGGDSSDNLDSI